MYAFVDPLTMKERTDDQPGDQGDHKDTTAKMLPQRVHGRDHTHTSAGLNSTANMLS